MLTPAGHTMRPSRTLARRRALPDLAAPRFPAYRIALHWAVVLLVLVQWMTADAIPRTHDTLLPPSPTDLLLHAIHNYSGMTIGVLVGLRVLLRLFTPIPPADVLPSWQRVASATIHWGLYLSLTAQAATGFVTSYFWGPAGQIHVLLWNVTLTLIVIHVAAAAMHAVRRDGVIARMLPRLGGSGERKAAS